MEMKQRIIGIIVLVALAVLLVPLIFDSEVALPPPNHLPVANTVKTSPTTNKQQTVAYQAPTIKSAQIQEVSDKKPVQNSIDDHEDFVVNDENQTPNIEDEVLDKPEISEKTTQSPDTEITAKETSSKNKPTNDELVKEAALKLAIQKESSDKNPSTVKSQNKNVLKDKPEQHRQFSLSDEKPKIQNKALSLASKQKNTNLTSTQGAWAIQLGSFSEKANANKLANNLKSKGFNAFTEPDKSRNNVHRVLVGPTRDRNTAEKMVAQLRSQSNIQGIIVRYKR